MMSHCRLSFALLVAFAVPAFGQPAFPGAEGAGANAKGGRGGDVYYVTTLANTGAGSLRNGITGATGPRTILFKVSGTIELSSDLVLNKTNITIAGQTAPGDGITLKRRSFRLDRAHNSIVRFIRCRAGDADSNFEGDALWVVNTTNAILDHISTSWSVDECLSVTWSTNITVQWCMISESLNKSQHAKGNHGYGSLLRYGYGGLTFHHNLYQHHGNRNPRLGDNIKLDFVNNVIYNWGGRAGYSGGNGPTEDTKDNPGGIFQNHINYVSNYLVAGINSSTPNTAFASGATNTVIYQIGNRIDSNKNTTLDGNDTGWGMFNSFPYTVAAQRYPLPQVTTDTAGTAYQRVLAFAGASAVRDSVDNRLRATVRDHKGIIIDAVGPADQSADYLTNNINGTNYVFVRGWPTLNSTTAPADADNDGIPDYFELAMGWNPAVANNNHLNPDGYTDLEWYLNWLAEPNALCNRNGSVDVSLYKIIGATNGFTFTVANGTNGTATLLGDNATARFVAPASFNGRASFKFNATNTATGLGFGPVDVGVFVTVTNAPNTAPVLDPVADSEVIAGATVSFTANATDTDSPAQTLTFSLLNAPSGAQIGVNDGAFLWRPTIAQGGTTNTLGVVVADNGTPAMSATQQFTVIVNPPSEPASEAAVTENGQFGLLIQGDTGPDYIIEGSTNLTDWTTMFTTNSPALPFLWQTPVDGAMPQQYFRVLLGP